MGKNRWYMEDNILKFENRGITTSFFMPEEFKLEDTHPDLLKLAEWALFKRYDPNILKGYVWTRKPKGKNIGLNYSGGVDSTAVLTLFDDYKDVHLFYCSRWSGDGLNLSNETNPLRSFKMVEEISGRKTNIIKNDLHKIRKIEKNLPFGFPSNGAMFIGSILLADMYDIKYITAEAVMVSCFPRDGVYRSFHSSEYWKEHTEIYRQAGLELMCPVMCCSQTATNKISNAGKYSGVGQSCVRSNVEGEGCLKCMKCFKKKIINGVLLPRSEEIKNTLTSDKIIGSLAGIGNAINKYNLDVPELIKYNLHNYDLSFMEDYQEEELGCVPVELRDYVRKELNKYIKPMSVNIKEFVKDYHNKELK